jgi:ribonuclease HI
MRYGDTEKSLYGGDPMTTNNRMELMAVIKGLEALTKPCKVKITSDSKYVLTGITDWINNWKARNWKTANKKPVQNVELWKQLDELAALHDIEWGWVKGHSGHRENEIADDLANLGIDEL